MSNGLPPAATMAAAPPLLPPGERSRSNGLFVIPYTRLSVSNERVNSGVLVLPSRIAPCLRTRDTTVASRSGTNPARPWVPPVLMTPAVSNESLIVIGTPCSSPQSSPRESAASASRARASAASL